MIKKYKCHNCENEATILMISRIRKSKGTPTSPAPITPIHRIMCEECYNRYLYFYGNLYRSDLPVSAIDDIDNIIDILDE